MKKVILYAALPLAALMVVVFGYRGRVSKTEDQGTEINAVRAVIEAQQQAWNRGDIEAFMDGYAKDDSITFVSGDSVNRGWQTVLERYRKNYDSRARMGTLTFSELEFKPLSEFYVIAVGRFELERESDHPRGRFTLIFRRTTGGWRIVHDHTSSA